MEESRVFGATTSSSKTLLVLFVPSNDRFDRAINQDYWVGEALEFLGKSFGGATAFPKAKGVWRDDAQGGKLLYDEPVVIQCYTGERPLEQNAEFLRQFLVRMGTEARQGAIGFVIDNEYFQIEFPLLQEESHGEQRQEDSGNHGS